MSSTTSSSSARSNGSVEKNLLGLLMDANYENSGVDVNLRLCPPQIQVKKCQLCGQTSTPLWRNGPHGPKTACNACGIRFRKELRRLNTNLTLAPPCSNGQSNSRHNK
ncbi:hypothetical protein HPP92_026376 [Vanilla planifolia]|uniref:GATA-type domain-containing protein n=1 Tax=Vanilla planifolia TaxID=51239 RepID=A0A835PEG9_VANPL|nr:hypothetical protein HPP92_026376 [Vanilla planifolia]